MKNVTAANNAISEELIEIIRSRLEAGERVRRSLPGGGRLHIDRPLPFLCVHRFPEAQKTEVGVDEIVTGEASFLLASGNGAFHKSLSKLVEAVVESLARRFDAFLIVEIWPSSIEELVQAEQESELEPTEFRPSFVVGARGPNTPARTVDALRRYLEKTSYLKQRAQVRIDTNADGHPPKMSPLLTSAKYRRLGCETIGLSIRPIYRSTDTNELFPAVLRSLKKSVGKALKQAFFTFTKTRTNAKPEHYYSLGRRAIVKAVTSADRQLSEISESFSFLLQITPVNAEAAWHEFRRSRFERTPRFYYRPMAVDAGELKRNLFNITIERIEDPTLAELFRQRRDELDSRITMLTDVGTSRFRLGSQLVFGELQPTLVDLAKEVLSSLGSRTRNESASGKLGAIEFAELARTEVALYRQQMPEFRARVEIRDDLFSGLMCTGGDLLVGAQLKVPVRRSDALIQHEVGTHLLTFYNGLKQPFQLLSAGFAGYDSLQEGLAVLSEFVVGGLSRPRLRLLAARVVAVDAMLNGASFVDTFRLMDRDYDFSQRAAYTITMRVYRGGGLTKDAVYLRGLVDMLSYLGKGGELEPLLTGKIATDHIVLVRELLHRKVIVPPALRPSYLARERTKETLEWLAQGRSVLDLIKESGK